MNAIKKQLSKQVEAVKNNQVPANNHLAKQAVKSKSINVFGDSESFKDAQRMANALATADFTPQTFRGKMANCLLALEMANRMGASVVAVMQNMYVVKGKPAWSATYIIAAINTSGRFQTTLMYEMDKDDKGNINGCFAYAIDKHNNRLEGPKVTAHMVKSEGWLSNPKWTNMPDLMYRYRAASFFGKLYTPDILMGMQTVEEIEDVYDVQVAANTEETTHPEQTQDNPLDDTPSIEATNESPDCIDADIEDETPAYMEEPTQKITVPPINSLDDLKSFITSLGLDMEIKKANTGLKFFAGITKASGEGFTKELQTVGFKLMGENFVRDVSDLMKLKTQNLIDDTEAEEIPI